MAPNKSSQIKILEQTVSLRWDHQTSVSKNRKNAKWMTDITVDENIISNMSIHR